MPGAAGHVADLTDSVNQLAGNLTDAGPRDRRGRHRRDEGRPARRSISVDAQGEVLS